MSLKVIFFLPALLSAAAAFNAASPVATIRSRSPVSRSHLLLSPASDNDVVSNATTRRSFCASSLASLALIPQISHAAAEMSPYEDTDYGFKLQVPASWEKTEQKLSGRRKAIFFTDPNSQSDGGAIETFGFIAYTPIRDDFTSLSSFGSVDQVAQTTILPKGELAGQDTDSSKMLSAVSKNNAYYFDYVATPVVPTEPGSGGAMTKTLKPQHFRTIFTLLPLKGAAGLTLVTVTLQTTEERYADMKGVFDGVVDSYGKL